MRHEEWRVHKIIKDDTWTIKQKQGSQERGKTHSTFQAFWPVLAKFDQNGLWRVNVFFSGLELKFHGSHPLESSYLLRTDIPLNLAVWKFLREHVCVLDPQYKNTSCVHNASANQTKPEGGVGGTRVLTILQTVMMTLTRTTAMNRLITITMK